MRGWLSPNLRSIGIPTSESRELYRKNYSQRLWSVI
jgi:hypothetical protein